MITIRERRIYEQGKQQGKLKLAKELLYMLVNTEELKKHLERIVASSRQGAVQLPKKKVKE